ncbi:unnamed protein product [Durusdinium trenchii]|uniref:Uncharacterized protein n=1 Tax=Durusdinium trenchii TaxID=1381693 RepID=A0ABP0RGI0_9DINO
MHRCMKADQFRLWIAPALFGMPGEWVTSSQAYGNFLPEVNRAPSRAADAYRAPERISPEPERQRARPQERPWQFPPAGPRFAEMGGHGHDQVQHQLVQMHLQLQQQQLQLELLQRQMQQQQILARVHQSPWVPRRYRADELW